MKIDIHNYARQAELALVRLDNSEATPKNKEAIKQFVDHCVADNMSVPRIAKYIDVLRFWALWLGKDFDAATKDDIAPIVTKLQLNEKYSPWTKQTFKVMIRRFYSWLRKTDNEYPEEVKWISIKMKLSERRLPGDGDLLNEDDVKRLLEVIDHPRDKAFVSMLWESGCRVGELSSLTLRSIDIDKYGILITVEGKTGSRKLRLISSTEYLMAWLKMHPCRNDRDSPLWVNRGNVNIREAMHYRNIAMMLRAYFASAGIKKRTNPHLFRHSRATYMANYLTEFQMNQYFGWAQGSNMPSTYVHMSGRELDGTILALNGIKDPENKKHEFQLQPKTCPRCDSINSYDSKYCHKCAGILDVKEAVMLEEKRQEEANLQKQEAKMRQDSDSIMNKLMQIPEVQRFIAQKLVEMGGLKGL